MSIAAVILVGGISSDTQFRPLSLEMPKPLFPIAGTCMIWPHLEAMKRVQGLEEVYLLGDFAEDLFKPLIEQVKQQLGLHITFVLRPRPSPLRSAPRIISMFEHT